MASLRCVVAVVVVVVAIGVVVVAVVVAVVAVVVVVAVDGAAGAAAADCVALVVAIAVVVVVVVVVVVDWLAKSSLLPNNTSFISLPTDANFDDSCRNGFDIGSNSNGEAPAAMSAPLNSYVCGEHTICIRRHAKRSFIE